MSDYCPVFSGPGAQLQAHDPVFYYQQLRRGPPPTTGRRWNREQNAIQPQFLMPVRIMPDFDIFTDGPATVLAVLNLWIQISQTAGASGDWWHSQHRPKQYRVDPSFQTSGGRSHQFVSARQYKAACNEADEFSARVICEDQIPAFIMRRRIVSLPRTRP